MNGPLRIVKVGGSLFDLPDLAARLERWLAAQPPAVNVLLAGGGPLADVIRRWDASFALGQERSHWMCIDLLDVTARLLSSLLPRAQICDDWRELRSRARERATLIFAPGRFLRDDEACLPGPPLPRSWDATSDSIAARLAEVTAADELVLLKSSLPAHSEALSELSGAYFDAYFVAAAQKIERIRAVNLREAAFSENL